MSNRNIQRGVLLREILLFQLFLQKPTALNLITADLNNAKHLRQENNFRKKTLFSSFSHFRFSIIVLEYAYVGIRPYVGQPDQGGRL
jgi:hypothetical protein